MAKVQSGNDLPEESPRLLGREPALLDKVVEELTTGDVF